MSSNLAETNEPTKVFALDAAATEVGREALARATVTVVDIGALVPGVVSHLARLGVGTIRLLGQRRIEPVDVQQSRHLEPADVGQPLHAVLAARLGGSATLVDHGPMPTTKLDWQERLGGSSLAIVPVPGPILFLGWVDAFNEAALDAGTAWLTCAQPTASELHIGPTFVPGVTGCYKCFEMRYKSHLSNYEAYLAFEAHLRNGAPVQDFGVLPPWLEAAASLVACEAARALLPDTQPVTVGTLVTFELTSFQMQKHPLLPLPRCLACSPTRNAPARREWI